MEPNADRLAQAKQHPRWRGWLRSLHLRLLLVNLVVLLVPVAGLEFARLYERELLRALERDMRHQAISVRFFTQQLLAREEPPLHDGAVEAPTSPTEPEHSASPDATEATTPTGSQYENLLSVRRVEYEAVLRRIAVHTRMRFRILGRQGNIVLDSHRHGPPEGEEPEAPSLLPGLESVTADAPSRRDGPRWKKVPQRPEVLAALRGERSAHTRIRKRHPSVLLFVAEPIYAADRVIGVSYITRSTQPVMVELYRIRNGLWKLLSVAIVGTVAITLLLALSVTTPLSRLSRTARRIAEGDYNADLPVSGSGEVRDLALAFRKMNQTLRKRLRDTAGFAADVAHAFKSPLTSIRGAAELLGEGASEDPEVRRRFLRNIETDAERLDLLVSRLLQLSRIEASEEPFRLHPLPELLREATERSETPDVRIELHCARGLEVYARRTDLLTALANLLDNATKATPSGEAVTISATAATHPEGIHITITDTGPGVPASMQSKIFQRFYTTDKQQGTGLGLAIARAVAEAHGGRLEIDPDYGNGARFVMWLPTNAH